MYPSGATYLPINGWVNELALNHDFVYLLKLKQEIEEMTDIKGFLTNSYG
jgi:hypothetical protein